MAKRTQRPRRILRAERQSSRLSRAERNSRPQCGLCGSTENLTQTECCGEWICNDEDQYVLFSYAHNSCSRNHRRYTLCGRHFEEGHEGRWHDCTECRQSVETEMYVHFGTNEYNFETLSNPPAYEPTHCAKCGNVIELANGGYSRGRDGFTCMNCVPEDVAKLFRSLPR